MFSYVYKFPRHWSSPPSSPMLTAATAQVQLDSEAVLCATLRNLLSFGAAAQLFTETPTA